jgi:hypothetical protein
MKAMSTRHAKMIRRQINKEINSRSALKIEGLIEFVKFYQKQSFLKRLKFAVRILFKKFKV